jgi:hypothetical protein
LAAGLLLALALTGLRAQQGDTNQRIEALLGPAEPYQRAVETLRDAVARGDAAAVAALVHYPITVHIDGQPLTFSSADELQRRYAQVFTPAVVTAIRSQPYERLFVNAQGLMFGSGELWLAGICSDARCSRVEVKVVTIGSGARR